MESVKDTGDQVAVESVDIFWRIGAEEGQGASVSKNRHSDSCFISLTINKSSKGTIINGEYYVNLLDRYIDEFRKNNCIYLWLMCSSTKKYARVHKCVVAMVKLNELIYDLLPQLLYSSASIP